MKFTLITFIFFMIYASISGAAHASSFDSKIQALYSPELVEAIIKQQINHHGNLLDLPESSALPIDGDIPAVEVSNNRTSLPDEYMAMPTSKNQMERYAKGN